jgi:hypothetical protein
VGRTRAYGGTVPRRPEIGGEVAEERRERPLRDLGVGIRKATDTASHSSSDSRRRTRTQGAKE